MTLYPTQKERLNSQKYSLKILTHAKNQNNLKLNPSFFVLNVRLLF